MKSRPTPEESASHDSVADEMAASFADVRTSNPNSDAEVNSIPPSSKDEDRSGPSMGSDVPPEPNSSSANRTESVPGVAPDSAAADSDACIDAQAVDSAVPAAMPADEFSWVYPGPADDVSTTHGPYRGRAQVGDVGAMLRVLPSVRSILPGVHVPDSIVDAGVVSSEVSVGAVSVKGPSHHLSAAPRQDSYTIGTSDTWTVIAIADGVSDGKLSHVAAREAARVATAEALRSLVDTEPAHIDWSGICERTRQAVRAMGLRRARQQVHPESPLPDISDRTIASLMATTCDLLVIPNERIDGSLRVYRVRIAGDSSFYIIDPARGWLLMDGGKSLTSTSIDNSVSDPLPIGGSQPHIDFWDLNEGQIAVLCTDGFGDVIGSGALPVGRFLFDAWGEPLDTAQLLWTSSFLNVNADDDRTAAIVWATS